MVHADLRGGEGEGGASDASTAPLTAERVLPWLSATPFVSPLYLDALNPHEFMDFIIAKTKTGSEEHQFDKEAYDRLRFSLEYLFALAGAKMTKSFNKELGYYYRGLNHVSGHLFTNVFAPQRKARYSFELYRAMSAQLMQETGTDSVFMHTLLVLSWNLNGRGGDAASTRFADMTWRGDTLMVTRDGQGQPKHVYANPTDPMVCPILSLGVYFATVGLTDGGDRLFPGSNLGSRLNHMLTGLIEGDGELVKAALALHDKKPDFGPHSLRTGANGHTTRCAYSTPMNVGKVLRPKLVKLPWMPVPGEDEIGNEDVRDQLEGRFICGLPFDKPSSFATLPPFFRSASSRTVTSAVRACFPRAPASLRVICQFALASLCHHAGYLREDLPPEHPVFSCALFSESDMLRELRQEVVCRVHEPTDRLHPTGIPQYVARIVDIERSAVGVVREYAQVREAFTNAVREAIRRRYGSDSSDSDAEIESLDQETLPTGWSRGSAASALRAPLSHQLEEQEPSPFVARNLPFKHEAQELARREEAAATSRLPEGVQTIKQEPMERRGQEAAVGGLAAHPSHPFVKQEPLGETRPRRQGRGDPPTAVKRQRREGS